MLLVAAVAEKFIGAGAPALLTSGVTGAALIGVSMILRAEIAMTVLHQARQMGDWAMPEPLYASMVFVSITTCNWCVLGPVSSAATLAPCCCERIDMNDWPAGCWVRFIWAPCG